MTITNPDLPDEGKTSNEDSLKVEPAALEAIDPFAKPEDEKPIIEINEPINLRPNLSNSALKKPTAACVKIHMRTAPFYVGLV